MYVTVQTANDIAAKILMSFKLAALDPHREVFFSLTGVTLCRLAHF